MGFWDSMKGLGRSVMGVLETGVEVFGPPIAQAAAGALAQRIAGGNNMGMGAYPAGGYGGYGGQVQRAPRYTATAQLPPQYSTPQIYRQPAGRTPLQAPGRVPPSWSPIQPGGYGGVQAAQRQRPVTGYRPAGLMSDVIEGGLNYLTEGQFNMPAFELTDPGTAGGGLGSELMERFRGMTGGLPTMYRYGQTRATPVREIQAVNPDTGKIGVWKYMGRPILYTGDLAACKRVQRISRRVARRRPR